MSWIIRPFAQGDLEAINSIYNHYISNTSITFDIDEWTMEKREAWLAKLQKHPGMYHLLVAEIDGSVVGFAYNNEFREKLAYQTSTEVTIYLKPDMSVKGLGSALLSHLISDMKKSAFRRAYSLITLPNQVSEALHRKFGFVQVGQMTEVGFKFGQFHDVAIYELPLHSGNTPKG